MKLVHFINSITLMSLLVLFLVAQTVPSHINSFDDIPEEKNFVGMIKSSKLKAGLHAKLSIENLSENRQAKRIALGLLAMNAIFWPILCLFSTKRKDRITLEVNGGKVSFKILALEDSLKNSLKGDPQVKVRRVMVNPTGRSISITAEVTLLETENIQHLDERIIAHLKNHFEKIFPVQKPVQYEVVIGKLKPSGTPMGVQSAPSSTPVPPPPAETVASSPAPTDKPLYPDNEIEDNKESN